MRSTVRRARTASGLASLALLLALSACGGGEGGSAKGKGGPGAPGSGPPTVGYVIVQPTSVESVSELPGRTVAYESSQVRPQITGVIQKRFFTEGALVKRGQPLYQIDPSIYRAAANQARANVANAQATFAAAKIRADRYKPLADMEAISAQDYTDAVATQRQAAAQIGVNTAQLDSARVNLRFTTVPAPITGRIGRSLFTVGALVSATQADPLATIQQLDPMFVDIQQSSANLLALRRALAGGGAVPARAEVTLKLEDGTDYGIKGVVEFAEVVVDQSTGTVTLRARFPNPQGLLLPGMFVRAQFAQSIQKNAFLVPQTAISRDAKGNATLFVVGANNKAEQRTVKADRTQGQYWVVTGRLNGGERVITQGLANLRPGGSIKPVPANAPQPVKAPSPEEMKKMQGSAKGKAG
ncbi:efflux RND transporter periplasmic adaptor subunit [uncultured Sphingomonas sp.]|uniref:efflux RND transporter periplasmic adaptor subunit n=1 Tax=uncultured Sphingomonas sp. TaxID=158754 RepID=UPI003748E8EE